MRKNIARIIAMIIIMAAFANTIALAAETRASLYIQKTSAYVDATGGGDIDVWFTVSATGIMTQVGAKAVRIYKSDGTLVKTFKYTDTGYEYLMGYNTFRHSGCVSYEGTSGQSYYAIVSLYAENSNGSDTISRRTTEVTA